MNLKNIKLESYITMEDFFVYDIQGEMEGSIEVQFDNNKFNGNILSKQMCFVFVLLVHK